MEPEYWERARATAGGHNGWLDLYGLMSMAKLRFLSPELLEQIGDHVPHEDVALNRERMNHWHPLNRELHFGARAHLAGLLLNAKGDRVAMHNSVETRYPFLDEEVFQFLANVDPRWKLRGLRDKVLLRKLAERWLPKEIAWRRKAMFRAPFDSFHLDAAPPFVEQLLSEESLRKTSYFNVEAVQYWRKAYKKLWPGAHGACRSRWAWSASSRRSCGTTRSSTAASRICRRGRDSTGGRMRSMGR